MTIVRTGEAPPAADPTIGFHPAVRAWFSANFGAPSPPQLLGWPVIRAGENVLILSATGTGKTLAAFLEVLSRLYSNGTGRGVQVIYISPLKALNNDIARNLTGPLRGIAATAGELGLTVPEIRVAVRTGDTPARERQAMVRKPPDILITTPESLFLLLSSPRAREILRPVHTIIIDEIHAMAGNKRGVHLSLSVERLAWLAGRPLQRIGLSATQRPLELIASYLGGEEDGAPRPVRIVDARLAKEMLLQITMGPDELAGAPGGTLWPAMHEKIYTLVQQHRSTLIFVNARAVAEKVTLGLNQLAGHTLARTHHGSLSRSVRESVETSLKKGELQALVCTSSLELGIDVGAVDLVIQVESPRSASSGLQRVGRSGHVLGAASRGIFLAKMEDDLLDMAWVGREMLQGEVEPTSIPANCLDVLAQQAVSMAGTDDWLVDDMWRLVRRSHCYRQLGREQLVAVLEMLSGRYPARDITELRPKLAWDRIADVLRALPGTRAAAVAGAGTIPDRAYYAVYLAEKNVRLGELDEEMVFESKPGDAFMLGNAVWRIISITNDRVLVEAAPGAVPKIPFWNGDRGGRSAATGRRVGQFWEELANLPASEAGIQWLQTNCALDEAAAAGLLSYIEAQKRHTGLVPSHRCLLLESYVDEGGDYRITLHSPFGFRVHTAWDIAVRHRLRELFGVDVSSLAADSGIMWRVPRGQEPPALELLVYLEGEAERRILAELPSSALFGAFFRMNSARSLVLGRSSPRKRLPLWLQRIKAGELLAVARQEREFPVALETFRECLHDVLDLPGLLAIQAELSAGHIQVEYRHTAMPSPFARSFLLEFTRNYLYNDDTPKAERKAQFLSLNRDLLQNLLGEEALRDLLDAEAIAAAQARRQHLTPGRLARTADELEEILLDLGDLTQEEAEERSQAPGLLAELLQAGRAAPFTFPGLDELRYIAAEEAALYKAAFATAASADESATVEQARLALLRRFARTHGPFVRGDVAGRYGWAAAECDDLAQALVEEGILLAGAFQPGRTEPEWCHSDVLQEVHRRTLATLRQEVEAVPGAVYARFLAGWQGLQFAADEPAGSPLTGADGLANLLDQFSGLFLPTEVWERDVLPARLPGYDPAWLDILCARGEYLWVLQPGGNPQHGKLAFFRREDADLLWPLLMKEIGAAALSPLAMQVETALRQRGAAFAHELAAGVADIAAVQSALWELALAGRATNDTFAPPRLGGKAGAAAAPALAPPAPAGRRSGGWRSSPRLRQELRQRATAAGRMTGRWSLLPMPAPAGAEGATSAPAGSGYDMSSAESAYRRLAEILLCRWGVVARDMLAAEGLSSLWGSVYRALRLMEMAGQARGGYFVDGLGGSQFALPEAVDRLRAERDAAPAASPLLLSSCDPAAVCGPLLPAELPAGVGYVRSPLNYVVLVAGVPALYIAGFGRTLWRPAGLSDEAWSTAARMLPALLDIPGHQRPRRSVAVQSIDGVPAPQSPAAAELRSVGFSPAGNSLVLWPSQRISRRLPGSR